MRIEFTVKTGKGYVPADRNRAEDAPIGLMPIDSLFSPVKKVSYRVEDTREGQDPRQGQADDDDRDQRRDVARGRARLRRAHPAGPARRVRQLRGAAPRGGPARDPRARLQPGAAQEGRRARAFGPLGQLPEERQHRLHRRPHPEDRARDAADAELRPQVAQRDQGSAGADGPSSRHGGHRAGRRRTSRISPSASRSTTECQSGRRQWQSGFAAVFTAYCLLPTPQSIRAARILGTASR